MSDFESRNNPDLTGGSDPAAPGPSGQQAQPENAPYGGQPPYSGQPQYTAPNQQPQYNDPNQQYGQPQYNDPNQQYGQPQNGAPGQQQYGQPYQGQPQPPYGDPNQQNPPYGQPFQQTINIQTPPPVYVNQKSKMAAGLLGIFLGSLGVHNFYLGYTGKAVAQLLIALLTCGFGAVVTGIWGLIEGIMILTGSIAVDGQGIPLSD